MENSYFLDYDIGEPCPKIQRFNISNVKGDLGAVICTLKKAYGVLTEIIGDFLDVVTFYQGDDVVSRDELADIGVEYVKQISIDEFI